MSKTTFYSINAMLASGLLAGVLVLASTAQAESLFRAGATYQAQAPAAAASLFTPPISKSVGDMVTITINDVTTQSNKAELKITRNQVLTENGSNLVNSMVGFVLDKLPFKTSNVKKVLSVPSFDNMSNNNNFDSKAEITHNNTIQSSIACQVVQVLPNGDLIVQGQKVMMSDKERQNLMVTGIVRPFYLDRNNQISSNMVGNFQMIQSGKGVVSRQQNDGLANKVYQFFN